MLRRNLEPHAKRICAACCDLEYFPHVLELLLHEVRPLIPVVLFVVDTFLQVLEDEAENHRVIVREGRQSIACM